MAITASTRDSTSLDTTDNALGAAFVAAVAAQDFAGLHSCFDPNVRFRALTPSHVWAHFGAASAVATIRDWFGDAQRMDLMASRIEHVGDRLSLSYLLRVQETDVRELCEQRAYRITAGDRISDISMICSGFRPEPD